MAYAESRNGLLVKECFAFSVLYVRFPVIGFELSENPISALLTALRSPVYYEPGIATATFQSMAPAYLLCVSLKRYPSASR